MTRFHQQMNRKIISKKISIGTSSLTADCIFAYQGERDNILRALVNG